MLTNSGRRLLVGCVSVGLVAASCGGESASPAVESTETSTTEATEPSTVVTVERAPTTPGTTAAAPEPTGPVATSPPTTSPPTTSPAPATTVDTSREDFEAAQNAIIDEIIANSASMPLSEAGFLDPAGAILDQSEVASATDVAIDVRVLVDFDGAIWFVVRGELGLLGDSSIEFDAVEANGITVVAETSVLGLDQGPMWSQQAAAGSVIQLSPPALADGPQLFRRSASSPDDASDSAFEGAGYLLLGDIGVQDGKFGRFTGGGWLGQAVRISIWLYLNLASASRSSVSDSTPDAPPPEDIQGSEWAFSHMIIEPDSLPRPSDVAMYRNALLSNALSYGNSVAVASQLFTANEAQGERLMWFYANE